MSAEDHPALRTYGRLRSRSLKPRQARLIDSLLPGLTPPSSPFDPRDLMPGAMDVWLEVGFGAGEHLVAQAERNPSVLLIGAEPFVNGFGAALVRIEDSGVTNVRVHPGDARLLMANLPVASLGRMFVLFPDPWPKVRHKKRRLIQPEFIAEAARLLRPGSRLRVATDWADYAHWTLELFQRSPAFAWTAERAEDWRVPPADHADTRYQAKRLGDCDPIWLEFQRI